MKTNTTEQTLYDVLSEKQILTAEQLANAKALCDRHGYGFEKALLELGLMSQEEIQAIYDEVFQIRSLKLEDVEIDPEALRYVPASIAHRYHLIPIRRSGNSLAIAMAEPTDREALAAMRNVTDFEIHPFAARYDAVEHALYLHYGDPLAPQNESVNEGNSSEKRTFGGLIEQNAAAHVGQSLPPRRNATFDNFVEDPANQFALSIARSISQFSLETDYNPFHFWGWTGSGKSFLLHSIANHVSGHFPLKRIILTNGERFVENLFECIRDNKLNYFRYFYRELDVLLVDDAHILLMHDWAQRELVDTFHYMAKQKKQLVLAASENLATEVRLIHELRVVLESGVIAGIGTYSSDGKREIILRQVGKDILRDDVVSFLTGKCGDDINSLLQVAKQAAVMTILDSQEVALSTVEEMTQYFGIDLSAGSSERIRQFLKTADNAIAVKQTESVPESNEGHDIRQSVT